MWNAKSLLFKFVSNISGYMMVYAQNIQFWRQKFLISLNGDGVSGKAFAVKLLADDKEEEKKYVWIVNTHLQNDLSYDENCIKFGI